MCRKASKVGVGAAMVQGRTAKAAGGAAKAKFKLLIRLIDRWLCIFYSIAGQKLDLKYADREILLHLGSN